MGNKSTADYAVAMSELDSLLAGQLDDIADLSTFAPFPNGHHVVDLTFEKKVVNGKGCVEATYVYVEALELSDAAVEAPKAGSKATALFQFGNEVGMGLFKQQAAVVGAARGIGSIIGIIDSTKEEAFRCSIVTKLRKYKDDSGNDRESMNISKVEAA